MRLLRLAIPLFILTGCSAIAFPPLPTRVPTAAAPAAPTRETLGSVPPTYTVPAGSPPEAAGPATRTPLPLPTPTLRPVPEPTPVPSPTLVAVAVSLPTSSDAAYLNAPPQTVPCGDRGLVFRSHFPSAVGGPWRSYHAYLPPCYGTDGRVYPVIYLIHGSIQTDSHWLDLGLARLADSGIASGRFPPFVAIMPFSGQLGNITSGGDSSVEGVTVNNLLPFVDGAFCTWPSPSGRSIGGISRGGYWALEIAFRNVGLFGAVSGHSSHLRFETDGPAYNPLATYATVDLSTMRIWMDRGETDFLRHGQDQLNRSLLDAGIAHDYRVNPGGHNDGYWASHLAEYLDWHAAVWPRDRSHYPPCG